jgi:hypothetical protein
MTGTERHELAKQIYVALIARGAAHEAAAAEQALHFAQVFADAVSAEIRKRLPPPSDKDPVFGDF